MQYKFNELNNFKIEVRNIFIINSYNKEDRENIPIIMNCLGLEGLRFVPTLTYSEQCYMRCSVRNSTLSTMKKYFHYSIAC